MASTRRLFISTPTGPELSQFKLQQENQPGIDSQTLFIEGTDITFPPPGGGLLRVPVGGGAASEMLGTIAGQITYWDTALARWAVTPTGPAATGYVPVWDSTLGRFIFAPQLSPGAIQYFDTTHAPAGLWNFNNSLADTSGNGNDMVLNAGSLAFADVVPGKLGLFVLEGARYQNAVNAPPALLIPGDLTMLAIVQLDRVYTDLATICAFAGNGAAAPENIQYSLNCPGSATTALQRLQCNWENGAGVAQLAPSSGDVSLPPIHNVMLIAIRRQANVYRFYLNGLPFGPNTAALPAPSGGGGATRFIVGALAPTGGSASRFVLFSLKIVASALSDADVKAEYNRTMGPAFGFLP